MACNSCIFFLTLSQTTYSAICQREGQNLTARQSTGSLNCLASRHDCSQHHQALQPRADWASPGARSALVITRYTVPGRMTQRDDIGDDPAAIRAVMLMGVISVMLDKPEAYVQAAIAGQLGLR